jgi:1-acyl-sn-glycerol-3-phosphate acyltransferase
MTVLRSLIFNILFFAITAGVAVLAVPLLAAPPGATRWMTRIWSRLVIGLLRLVCDARLEVRGMENIPPGGCVIASKHQSAFDTIVWLSLLPDTAYVLKKELLSIPVYGWHVRRAGMIPVDRAGGGPALRSMLRLASAAVAAGRQVVIFPEGTRSAPGQRLPYQPGVVAIATGTGAPVLPVATDSGRIWGRRAFHKHRGIIRISILPPLPPGLKRDALLRELEERIEGETAKLLAEPVDKSVH